MSDDRAGNPSKKHVLSPLLTTSVVLVAFTYALLVLGSTVRVNGAGLACPDWPLCFGQVVPDLDFQVGLEYFHRVLAGLISLGFLGLGIGLFRRSKESGGLRWLWGIAGVVLVVQIVLGGLTVLELLAEWTVTSHLLTGNTFCLLLFLIALFLRNRIAPVVRKPVTWIVRFASVSFAVILFAQLAMGGMVSSRSAGLACGPTWPDCGGAGWFPTMSGDIGLQVQHRLLAYLLLFAAVVLVGLTRGRGRVGRGAIVTLCVVLVQVLLGISNVLFHIPVEVSVLHSAGAAAIVLCATWLNYEAWRSPLRLLAGESTEVRPLGEVVGV